MVLRLPHKHCSSFCLWKSCILFLLSPSLPLHSSVHFPGCHLGQPGEELTVGIAIQIPDKGISFIRLAPVYTSCSLISTTWVWYSMPLLTCVTVRRILRPLSWSPRLASGLSSPPDSCSSSGCSSTTASGFTLMSGIKDYRTETERR